MDALNPADPVRLTADEPPNRDDGEAVELGGEGLHPNGVQLGPVAGGIAPCFPALDGHGSAMSTVQEIEFAIKNLSPAEMNQIRDWLEEILEDQREFTPEFQARLEAADRELASGARPRVHRP